LLGSYQPRQGASGGRLEQAANDAGALLLEFDNGAQATLRFSAVAQVGNHGDEIGFRLYGEKGTLSSQLNLFAPQYQVWGVQDADADVSEITIPTALMQHVDYNNVLHQFLHESIGPRLFVDAILDNTPLTPEMVDGYRVQQVIDAALESYRTGQRITLDRST
jgi:predicted dehydrogenase